MQAPRWVLTNLALLIEPGYTSKTSYKNDASATMGADLALARYFFGAAAVVQLGGSVLIWQMIDWFWFSTACCL
jgi:hypothetical protein